MAENRPPPGDVHVADLARIKDYDERNEYGEILCHVWCQTCGTYEWHWVMEDVLDAAQAGGSAEG
jgi:hypothetical protein